jgi:hypothetical protein
VIEFGAAPFEGEAGHFTMARHKIMKSLLATALTSDLNTHGAMCCDHIMQVDSLSKPTVLPPAQTERPLLFVHIPKTAGTSFHALLHVFSCASL